MPTETTRAIRREIDALAARAAEVIDLEMVRIGRRRTKDPAVREAARRLDLAGAYQGWYATASTTLRRLAPERLELEITESVLVGNPGATTAILHSLKGLGVRVSMDDFGTGYSSLSYLQRFPFDKIKIDRCFVESIDTPNGSLAIVQAVANIASAQLMDTTAEGVETKAQRDMLLAVGCTEMQGYLFSKPKPAAEIGHFIQSNWADEATVA